MPKNIELKPENFTAVHTEIARAGTALRVIKKDKIDQYDQNTYAKINGLAFHNGEIEMKLKSRLLPDAPGFARGFVGLVFRASRDDSEFESFYVRPTNGRDCTDPVRKAHGCQYFSYPGYTFDYFREFGITTYEAPINLALDEWFTLRAVIEDGHAEFYLNGESGPTLTVDGMKHGVGQHGSVGVFVDIGTEAFVSEIYVTCTD